MIDWLKRNWFGNLRRDVLAGLVVALALIPESLAFSAIAGVDPKVALYASFTMAVTISIAGGRPAMISAATGAMALLMVGLVRDHGLQYLFAAGILTGVLQFIAGVLRIGDLMRFVTAPVVGGFLNALGVMVLLAQLPEFYRAGWSGFWPVLAIVVAGLLIIYLFPRLTRAIPSPMVCIVLLTLVSVWWGLELHRVGDIGALPDDLPSFLIPDVPWNLETLSIILPYSATMALVGLMESLMTAEVVDEMTNTESDKNRECRGQGIANLVTGLFGGMAGCGMIGQTVINVRSGGYTRLSTMTAGLGLLVLVVFFGDWAALIPMAALVAVMIMVALTTINWASVHDMRRQPPGASLVMLTTMGIVLATHNLALGVIAGVSLTFCLKRCGVRAVNGENP
ncbi:sodium-independent anion transporter [Halotalea alkalilenta]|uniref:Sodium-independent anion transporter n=1 Tax=Halotalea alkalilenta TaxID=376489 RepID=A0A172YCR3_9GAMM|nr:sodium-independent anion transporter [Halotalea alkalilenta]